MAGSATTSHWNNPSALILLTSIDCALGYLSGRCRTFLTVAGLSRQRKEWAARHPQSEEGRMQTHKFNYIAAVGLVVGLAAPVFAEEKPLLLAQLGTKIEQRLTKDQAVAMATKVKQGSVRKVSLEKRDNQVVWEVAIEDGNRTVSFVRVDPKSGNIIATVDSFSGK
jgi:uncharacterized membrane protein YkoI